MSAEEAALAVLARGFASGLTETVQIVAGSSCPPFTADTIGAAVSVRQKPDDGILLMGDDALPLLRLEVTFRCIMDSTSTYLAVDRSSFKVFSAQEQYRDPLLRYEYVRNQAANLPAAHLHVHGQHEALTGVLAQAGSGTRRGKGVRRKAFQGTAPVLRDLHLPVGGHRFRPCLEDLMAMLIEEFGVRPDCDRAEAAEALAVARAEWRRQQVGTAVRDAPEEAARVLAELGYEVTQPDTGAPTERTDRLRAL